MAEKSFGVKEVNLIGASGTPTITSPNNLNLNAINVAISTNVSIGGTLSVTGNVSVGGTLTYEDVTNIDSVGLITARNGIDCNGDLDVDGHTNLDNVSVAGVSTFSGVIKAAATGDNAGIRIHTNSGISATNNELRFNTSQSTGFTFYTNNDGGTSNERFAIGGAGQIKLPAAGIAYGAPGQVLTSQGTTSAATWTYPSINPTTSDIQVVYEITNQTSFSYYRFAGNGVDSSADDPDLYLMRGFKYRFINNSPGGSHPFKIRTYADASTSSDTYNYNTGVTGQGNSSGNIDFAVPYDAPAVLYYQCGNHSSMFGKIYIRGAGGQNDNVGFTTFSQGIDIDDAAASQKWTINNNSANTLRFMRGTTTDFAFGPAGQLGLGGWGASAYGAEGQVARSNASTGGSPEWASSIYYPSIYKDFDPTGVNGFTSTSFPDWVEKITIMFFRVSLTGNDNVIFQFKNSGGDVTSGYDSYTANATGSYTNTSTSGFIVGTTSASQVTSGTLEIFRVDTLKWVSTHCVSTGNTNMRRGAGALTITSGGLPTGWFIHCIGTNTFDGNTRFSISYQ